MITGTTLGKLIGKSSPLRASSPRAKHPPCHEPSPCNKLYTTNSESDINRISITAFIARYNTERSIILARCGKHPGAAFSISYVQVR